EGVDRPGIEAVIADARERTSAKTPIERIDWNAVAWEIGDPESRGDATAPAAVVREPRHRAASVPAAPADAVDLTVVVVFFNMQREAARTLLSLSRSYQRGLEEIDYEVIAVDNGSRADQRLGDDYVRSFGPEFRYLDLGADASPSPTVALNRAAAMAHGR